MIHLPNLLLIGATGRNVGKTEYACRLVKRLAAQGPVAAAKITVIREGGSSCPRGGEGCGVCGSLAGQPYLLQSEDCKGSKKDTHRLLDTGASPVWWLRVRRADLDAGLAALVKRLDPNVPVVAESNSARLGLEPGIFVVMENPDGAMKETCRAVMPLADVLIKRVGDTWDVPPERLIFSTEAACDAGTNAAPVGGDGAITSHVAPRTSHLLPGHWRLDADVGAVVLAGGRSQRMGRDKALLPFAGQPLIAHIVTQMATLCEDVLIGSNEAERFSFLARPVIADRRPGEGPLMGLVSCLAASTHELNVVLSCDVPTVDVHFLRRMLAAAGRVENIASVDAVVPVDAEGRPEPLYAVYRRSCVAVAEEVLAAGGRSLRDLLARLSVRYVPLPEGDWFRNLNTPEDYHAALAARGISC